MLIDKRSIIPLQEKICQCETGVEGAEPHRDVNSEMAEHCVLKETK